jgi:hypothetical protein
MTVKDVHLLKSIPCEFDKGYLVRVDLVNAYADRDLSLVKWFVGILHQMGPCSWSCGSWACSIIAIDREKRSWIQLPVSEMDELTPLEPTDIPRYLNNLTNFGANFLKEPRLWS